MSTVTHRRRLSRALAWILETMFVLELLFLGLTLAVVALSGINPLTSPVGFGILAAALVIVPLHHVWYSRHRREFESGTAHHGQRERRGF